MCCVMLYCIYCVVLYGRVSYCIASCCVVVLCCVMLRCVAFCCVALRYIVLEQVVLCCVAVWDKHFGLGGFLGRGWVRANPKSPQRRLPGDPQGDPQEALSGNPR